MELNNITVHKLDKEEFDSDIKPDWKNGKQINIFCSFTYITPNYAVLFTLNELKKFVEQGNYRIFLVIWDMNTLANPYFKKMCASRKIPNPDFFIDQKIVELKDIAESIGFNKEKFSVYKSSDLWKRFISYSERNIFQDFYAIQEQLETKNFVANKKVSHLIQMPMDMFFCNYFHKLYPEDTDRSMDLAFFGQNKENLYTETRELMIKAGLIEDKKPVFVLMTPFPYLIHNNTLPEWEMGLKDIKNILVNFPITKKEIFTIFRYIANIKNIRVKQDDEILDLDYKDFYEEYKDKFEKELIDILAENLFRYLKEHRKKFLEASGKIEESVLNITKKQDVKSMGQVLKSNIALEILLLANGTRNTSQISKELAKSVPTISTYTNKLKKLNLIRTLPDGKLKRNIKGVKINFELGL